MRSANEAFSDSCFKLSYLIELSDLVDLRASGLQRTELAFELRLHLSDQVDSKFVDSFQVLAHYQKIQHSA